jgi:hypothetical protein
VEVGGSTETLRLTFVRRSAKSCFLPQPAATLHFASYALSPVREEIFDRRDGEETSAEFTERFGPTQQDYDTVVAFAKENGFNVVGGTRDGFEIQIKGTVANIEKAFHVTMRTYQHPNESRSFFAPDREPTADLPFSLWHVSGMDNYSIPHPMLVKKSDYAKAHGISPDEVVSHATTGSGPSASFLGSDMRAAYYGGTALTGRPQPRIV